ncbi:hypothetical protein GCM10017556_23140 [Micromonospora sagamiensis]|nr:hypothetical protein GCM10017556_23140 [Micromonospora sagamiensis]
MPGRASRAEHLVHLVGDRRGVLDLPAGRWHNVRQWQIGQPKSGFAINPKIRRPDYPFKAARRGTSWS